MAMVSNRHMFYETVPGSKVGPDNMVSLLSPCGGVHGLDVEFQAVVQLQRASRPASYPVTLDLAGALTDATRRVVHMIGSCNKINAEQFPRV